MSRFTEWNGGPNAPTFATLPEIDQYLREKASQGPALQEMAFTSNPVLADAQAKLAPFGPTERSHLISRAVDDEDQNRLEKIRAAAMEEVAKADQAKDMEARRTRVEDVMQKAQATVNTTRLAAATQHADAMKTTAGDAIMQTLGLGNRDDADGSTEPMKMSSRLLRKLSSRRMVVEKSSSLFRRKEDYSLVGYGDNDGMHSVLLEQTAPGMGRRSAFGALGGLGGAGLGMGIGKALSSLTAIKAQGKIGRLASALGGGMGAGLGVLGSPRSLTAYDANTGDHLSRKKAKLALRIGRRLNPGEQEMNTAYGDADDLDGLGDDIYGGFAMDMDEAVLESPEAFRQFTY